MDATLRAPRLRAFPKPPQGHPVFDKIADKIGLLPPIDAEEVSAMYNVVTGYRIIASTFSNADFLNADAGMQNAMINRAADTLEKYEKPAQDLIKLLRAITGESFWGYLMAIVHGWCGSNDHGSARPEIHEMAADARTLARASRCASNSRRCAPIARTKSARR